MSHNLLRFVCVLHDVFGGVWWSVILCFENNILFTRQHNYMYFYSMRNSLFKHMIKK